MRILVFSWRDPKHPLAGGAEQVMHEHMKGWVTGGHNVTLFSSTFKNSSEEEIIDGIKIIRSGYQYLGVQLFGFFHYLKNKDKYDFVVDQFHGLPFFTPLFIKKTKLAVIQETAAEVWFLNPLPWPINWIIAVVGYLGEPFIFLFYRNVPFMTGSKSAKYEITNFGIPEKNITVISHGMIVKKPDSFHVKEKVFTVVYLGVLSKDKGIFDAIKCFSILDKKGKFQFWIIGRSENEKFLRKIKSFAEGLNFKNEIKFWGFVSQDKKFELLAKAHILINPSVREGWGLVNIEANALGTPVVAYPSLGLTDSVANNLSGIICLQKTPENLAENVLNLLKASQKYTALAKSAISWSKRFSWKKSVKLSLKLLEKLYQHP